MMYKVLIAVLLVSSCLAQSHPVVSECDNVGDKYLIVKDVYLDANPTRGQLLHVQVTALGMLTGVHVDTITVSLIIAGQPLNKDFPVSYDLVAGKTFTGTLAVTIPSALPKGTYKLQARSKGKGSVLACDEFKITVQ